MKTKEGVLGAAILIIAMALLLMMLSGCSVTTAALGGHGARIARAIIAEYAVEVDPIRRAIIETLEAYEPPGYAWNRGYELEMRGRLQDQGIEAEQIDGILDILFGTERRDLLSAYRTPDYAARTEDPRRTLKTVAKILERH